MTPANRPHAPRTCWRGGPVSRSGLPPPSGDGPLALSPRCAEPREDVRPLLRSSVALARARRRPLSDPGTAGHQALPARARRLQRRRHEVVVVVSGALSGCGGDVAIRLSRTGTRTAPP